MEPSALIAESDKLVLVPAAKVPWLVGYLQVPKVFW
jgi:hypothetical protein